MRRDLLHAARLAPHPNIIAVYGSAESGRLVVMERAATDLAAVIAFCSPPRRRLPLALAAAWTRDLLSAIDHLHAAGLAHMDIKSANVLLFSNRTAKLCDFGLSQGFGGGGEGDGGDGGMSVDRELVTLWSRPPELLMGYQTFTAAVDEWGAGWGTVALLSFNFLININS
jgi:serine/threonine protein kinase